MRQLRRDVKRKSVERDPALHADADSGDLVLCALALLRPLNPHADAIVAPFAAHIECRKRSNNPLLDGGDEAANVGRAAFQIEHEIADPLAGPVIGELAAAAGDVDRKAGLDQLLRAARKCRL